MKKIIAILLVLSVMFVAFGDVGANNVNLQLKASVTGRLFHGFSSDTTPEVAKIGAALIAGGGNISDALPVDYSDSNAIAVDLSETSAQDVGSYMLLSTKVVGAKVAFTITPMTLTIGSNVYSVPYSLGLTAISEVGTTISTASIGTAAAVTVGASASSSTGPTNMISTTPGQAIQIGA
ncbi:MAG: hypothetical protein EOM67_10250, partial [Spirochaetia bacterium]|nr:hypothetical protein [Spirochaetia bacterium]